MIDLGNNKSCAWSVCLFRCTSANWDVHRALLHLLRSFFCPASLVSLTVAVLCCDLVTRLLVSVLLRPLKRRHSSLSGPLRLCSCEACLSRVGRYQRGGTVRCWTGVLGQDGMYGLAFSSARVLLYVAAVVRSQDGVAPVVRVKRAIDRSFLVDLRVGIVRRASRSMELLYAVAGCYRVRSP